MTVPASNSRPHHRSKRSSSSSTTILNPAALNTTTANLPAGSASAATATADFNRDGKLDLVVTLASGALSSNIALFLGSGNGSFQTASQFTAGGLNPLSVITGDFNGDQNPDIVTANFGSDTVSLLLGTGTGSFSPAQTFRVGGQPNAVASGDFNEDGRLDLVTANAKTGANSLSLLLGNSSGFDSATSLDVKGEQPFAVVTGDFDRDGHLDILSADAATNTVSLFLGKGNGNFRSPSQFFVGSNPVALVTGDFNEDGKLDIATGNLGVSGENITVLLGDGQGNFSSSKLLSAGGTVNSLTVQDFNGDGHLDLAATLNNSAVLSILAGDGDGNFTGAGLSTINSAAQGLTAADVNQDGKTDWVSASSSSNVAVTLNKTPQVLLRSSSKLAEVDASQETDYSIKVDLTQKTLVVNSSPTVRQSISGFEDLLGSQLNDRLTGDSKSNRLNGNAGRDRLIGNAGNDQLTGGRGRDQLTGGSGQDRFIFDDGVAYSSTTEADRITDFESGRDKLVLDRSMFVGLSNRVSFATANSLEQAGSSTAKITYIRSTGRLYYNSDGITPGFGSGGLVAQLSGSLTQRDFSTQR